MQIERFWIEICSLLLRYVSFMDEKNSRNTSEEDRLLNTDTNLSRLRLINYSKWADPRDEKQLHGIKSSLHSEGTRILVQSHTKIDWIAHSTTNLLDRKPRRMQTQNPSHKKSDYFTLGSHAAYVKKSRDTWHFAPITSRERAGVGVVRIMIVFRVKHRLEAVSFYGVFL